MPHLSISWTEEALVVFWAVRRPVADDVEPRPRVRQRLPVRTHVVVRPWYKRGTRF